MKTWSVVLGLVCVTLVSASARADCHDAKQHNLIGLSQVSLLSCRAAVAAYADFYRTGTLDPDRMTPTVQLTVEQSPRQTINGQEAVKRKLQDDRESLAATDYVIREIDSDHLKVRKKFLFFWVTKTDLDDMGEVTWKGTIKGKNGDIKHEDGWAVVMKTNADVENKKPWRLVTLFITREDARPRR